MFGGDYHDKSTNPLKQDQAAPSDPESNQNIGT